MKGRKIAEFAHDLQSGLSRHTVPQFDRRLFVDTASIVAMHIGAINDVVALYLTRLRQQRLRTNTPGASAPWLCKHQKSDVKRIGRTPYLRGPGATLHRMIDIIAVPGKRGRRNLTKDVHNIHRRPET